MSKRTFETWEFPVQNIIYCIYVFWCEKYSDAQVLT